MQPSWREIESGFAEALLGAGDSILPHLREPRAGRSARGFVIHRNHYFITLADALKDNFPVTTLLVGDEFFAGMARIFVSRYPPSSAVLTEYGTVLPDFIEGFAPAGSVPYLADVARLEAAWTAAYHAAEATALRAADLKAIPLDLLAKCVVNFHPAARIVLSPHPIASIWKSHRGGSGGDLLWRAEAALVVRPEAEVRVATFAPAAGIYASLLMSGQTLEQAAVECAASQPSLDPGKAFVELVLAGAVMSLEPTNDDPRSPER